MKISVKPALTNFEALRLFGTRRIGDDLAFRFLGWMEAEAFKADAKTVTQSFADFVRANEETIQHCGKRQ